MHDIIATRQIACLLHAPGQCVVDSYKFSQENTNFGATWLHVHVCGRHRELVT